MTRPAGLVFVALIAQASAGVIEWESITEQQFRSLPASQPVRFEGRRTTLGDLRPKVEARLRHTTLAARKTPRPAIRGGPRPAIDSLLRQQRQRESSLRTGIAAGLARLRRQKISTAVAPGTTPYNTHVPVITNVLGILQPGGAVLIDGKNFGSTRGRVRLIAHDESWSVELEDLEWFDGGIGGALPKKAKVSGLPAKFVVELRSGAASNPWPVNWIEDVTMLPADDVAVVSCSLDSNGDHCNHAVSWDDEFCTKTVSLPWLFDTFVNKEPGPISIVGWHQNCWGAFGTDKGTDVYQVSLKNGWVLHDMEFHDAVNDPGGDAKDPGGFTPGATSWTASVEWFVQPAIGVKYGAIIYIRGPKGIPHK